MSFFKEDQDRVRETVVSQIPLFLKRYLYRIKKHDKELYKKMSNGGTAPRLITLKQLEHSISYITKLTRVRLSKFKNVHDVVKRSSLDEFQFYTEFYKSTNKTCYVEARPNTWTKTDEGCIIMLQTLLVTLEVLMCNLQISTGNLPSGIPGRYIDKEEWTKQQISLLGYRKWPDIKRI